MFGRTLNPDALEDLYNCCLNARGAYEAIKDAGLDKHLPGYESCLRNLETAIAKAEKHSMRSAEEQAK